MDNENACEAIRGSNRCNRRPDFLVTWSSIEDDFESTVYACADDLGRLLIDKEIDHVLVERVFE